MKDEIIEAIKAALLPELVMLREGQSELKIGLADIKAEIKVINGRLDCMDERLTQVEQRIREVHEDVREVRSYVWTGGYEKAKAERGSAVQEKTDTYGTKKS